MVRSSASETSFVPSGVKASRTIAPSCANRAITIGLISGLSRETNCQTRMLLSAPAATIVRPSGLKAQVYSALSGCGSVSMRWPSATRQTLHVSSCAGADEKAAVGAKGDVVDRAGVPFQRAQRLAGRGVPELDLFVVAAGGEHLAVGRELGIVKNVAVALEALNEGAVGDVPDGRHAPQAGDARGRDEPFAVGREMQGGDLAGELSHRAFRRTGAGRVAAVEADVVAARDGEPPAVARGVHRDHRLHLHARRDLGNNERQPVGFLALRSAGARRRSRPG